MSGSGQIVRAAGGIVVRRLEHGRVEVALVHRPAYDDWSFPKGKTAPEESDLEAALREVEEETGLVCAVERPVGRTRYPDRKGRDKRVQYWLMTPVEGQFRPTVEVDELRWVPFDRAADILTYEHDRMLLSMAGSLDV
jgi:8-oxo-dGTP diphosphatase